MSDLKSKAKEAAERALIEAYDGDDTRSKIGRIRELYDNISARREGGMSLEKILAALNKVGLDININTFRQYLHTIKRERASRVLVDRRVKPRAPLATQTPKAKAKVKAKSATGATPNEKGKAKTETVSSNPLASLAAPAGPPIPTHSPRKLT